MVQILTDLYKGWTDAETFKFWVPAQVIDISKSGRDNKKGSKRWIQGIASTNTKDLQGEIVKQSGIDFSYFMRHGYFNNDHKPGFENKVGEPTECKVTKNGLWVKGFLYENQKISDQIWELMHAQESTDGARRRIGFSIEGKVKRRDGNSIEECWIQDIAITPAPVNTATWAEIAKSLSSQDWSFNKSLEDNDEEAEKALTVGTDSPMVPESLDDETKKVVKSLTFDETINYIETSLGLPKEHANTVAHLIFRSTTSEE